MNLGEIKIQPLKLMFVNYNDDIYIEDIYALSTDQNYGSYLVNMTGSINRCFSSIEEKRVLPVKSYTLHYSDGEADNSFFRFNLNALIPDFFDIERLIYQHKGIYCGDMDYQREADILVLKNPCAEGTYRLLYYPKIARIDSLADNQMELDIPNGIAEQIPYFIKGDLYRDDEPNEASEARNWFEAAMDAIITGRTNRTGRVCTKYSLAEM